MRTLDLLITNGTVVTNDQIVRADIAVANGKVVSLSPSSETARETIDATGLHIFPGVIDAHVHFNDPGRADWEGLDTGSAAHATGGGTLFFDMPLNAHPPTINAEAFDLKLAAAQQKSITDFALWGGLVPGNVDDLEPLAERGVVGFKAFMSNSGIEDFSHVDDRTLREGMKRAARLKLPVAVHAESDLMTQQLAREAMAQGRTSIRDYLNSRPIAAELDAIRRALDFAGETGCALHVVHVSSGAGVAMIAEARAHGVNASCETCPHYLTLTDADVEKLGAVAKCAPPIRDASEQAKLWTHLREGHIHTVGSDHSPSPPSMKRDANFFKVWGGISSVQHTLPLILTDGHFTREISMALISNVLSTNVAARFKIPSKGKIAPGFDADLALIDLRESFEVRTDDLLYRHRQSPYVGRTLRGRVRRTLLRGHTVFDDGKIVAKPAGRLVKPAR